jgi:predicted DNA-binding transcriptional regulator AlpA
MSVRTTLPDRRGIGEMTIALRRDDHADVECEVIPKERHPVASNQQGGDLLRPRSAVFDALTPGRPARRASQADLGRQRTEQQTAEFIGIPEWCRRVGCSRESGYRAARRDQIPGLFRIGRLKRVNWSVFVNAAARANVGNGT